MMFIYKTAKFAPVWTTVLKRRAIFVHQTLTEYALSKMNTLLQMSVTEFIYGNEFLKYIITVVHSQCKVMAGCE